MDSLTQIALGSALSVAVMGRRTALWKAALWGGVAGTLPDLDTFIHHGDAILDMVLHRAESHSLLYLTLLAPLLGFFVAYIHGEAIQRWRWVFAMWAALFTHPLLDALTIYGTQLLQPFTDYPYGIGSLFIVDPAVTLPLLIGVGATLVLRSQSGLRWNYVGLSLASLYIVWSLFAQAQAGAVARTELQRLGLQPQALLVVPTPLNTLLWRVVATTPTHYWEGYISLLDQQPQSAFKPYARGAGLIEKYGELPAVHRIAAFSHSLYRLHTENGHLFITDLRMGQEPNYVFTFDLGPVENPGNTPSQQKSSRLDIQEGLRWIWQNL